MEKLVEGSIVQKAYKIDLDKLDEGYLSDSIICFAENRNKAKSILLQEIRYDDWKIKYTDEEVNYLNIPVKRAKSADKVIFEGKEVSRFSIDSLIEERIRLNQLDIIANNPNIKFCYIMKGNSYYRPNHSGYTYVRFEAGVYPKDEAVKTARHCSDIRLEWVDEEEHNKMINQKIQELRDKLIL